MRANRKTRAPRTMIGAVVATALLLGGASLPAAAGDDAAHDPLVATLADLLDETAAEPEGTAEEAPADPVEQPDGKKPESLKPEEESAGEGAPRETEREAIHDPAAVLPEPGTGLPNPDAAAEGSPGDAPAAEPTGRGPPASEPTSTDLVRPTNTDLPLAADDAEPEDIAPLAEDTATVRVRVGGDRTGSTTVQGLPGVTLGLFTAATGGDLLHTATSDEHGWVEFTVPTSAPPLWVRGVEAPDGWSFPTHLGTSPLSVSMTERAYAFPIPANLVAGHMGIRLTPVDSSLRARALGDDLLAGRWAS